jgi:hypothetical protein
MKKTIITLVLAVFSNALLQGQLSTEAELIRSRFKEEKTDLISSFMDFSMPEEKAFWPLYEEYEAKRTAYADKRISLLFDYVANYDALNDEQADEWSREVLKLQSNEMALKRKYYKKIAKALSPRIALRFFQFEESIHAAIRFEIMSTLPVLEKY